MQQRLIYWLVSGGLVFISPVTATEPDATRQGANYKASTGYGGPAAKSSEGDSRWVQQEVLPKTAEALAYFGDKKTIPAVAAGIMHVQTVQEGWLSLAGVWLRAEDVLPLQEAEKYFTHKLKTQATAFAYAMRGRARADLGRIDEAIADCNAALRLDAGFACLRPSWQRTLARRQVATSRCGAGGKAKTPRAETLGVASKPVCWSEFRKRNQLPVRNPLRTKPPALSRRNIGPTKELASSSHCQ